MSEEYAKAAEKISEIEKRVAVDPEMEIDLALASSENISIFESDDYQDAIKKIDRINAKIAEREQENRTIFGHRQKEQGVQEKDAGTGKKPDLAKDIYARFVSEVVNMKVTAGKTARSIKKAHLEDSSTPEIELNDTKNIAADSKPTDKLHEEIKKSIADLEGRISRRASAMDKIEKTGMRKKDNPEDMSIIDQVEILNKIIKEPGNINAGSETLKNNKQILLKLKKSAGEETAAAGRADTYMVTIRNSKIKEAEEALETAGAPQGQ